MTTPYDIAVRPARPEDVPAVVEMVHGLAEYVGHPQHCHLTDEQLHAALFAPQPALFCHVASGPSGAAVGFALWFVSYSTWAGTHGVHLEDLYVRPEARRAGAGRGLMATLAQVCVERGYQRMDWAVLRRNPAREFYHLLGAVPVADFVPYRLEGAALAGLARHAADGGTCGAGIVPAPAPRGMRAGSAVIGEDQYVPAYADRGEAADPIGGDRAPSADWVPDTGR